MQNLLYDVFFENEKGLVEDIIQQLKHSTSPHYTDLDWEILHQRVESLVAYFLLSLKDTPDKFTKYVTGMVEERISEEYSITECLMAMRVLEEKSWLMVVQNIPQQELIHSLSRVTGTIGAAKDHMAQIYVAHLEELQVPPRSPLGIHD